MHVPSFASSTILSNRTSQRIAYREDMHIIRTLADEDRQECGKKTRQGGDRRHLPDVNADGLKQGKEVAEWKGWKPVVQ